MSSPANIARGHTYASPGLFSQVLCIIFVFPNIRRQSRAKSIGKQSTFGPSTFSCWGVENHFKDRLAQRPGRSAFSSFHWLNSSSSSGLIQVLPLKDAFCDITAPPLDGHHPGSCRLCAHRPLCAYCSGQRWSLPHFFTSPWAGATSVHLSAPAPSP